MEQRFKLIEHWRESPESIAELARRFGVSRKTAYKWIERYQLGGLDGLKELSREPHVQARRTGEEREKAVLDLRETHPSWGPKKLLQRLLRVAPEQSWPARSTVGLILKRAGLTSAQRTRRRAAPRCEPLAEAKGCNDVWSIDFKGWFRCGDGSRCEPLTVSDAATRYLLCCQVLRETGTEAVQQRLTQLFRQHGLPQRMRSDNGPPFASCGLGGLSQLSVWWVKLGILPERIDPGEPQQNGRHERMHRTLKRETARPPAGSLAAQQKRFDEFVRVYNQERPHEALNGATPADLYQGSRRDFPEKLPEFAYPAGFAVRRADQAGKVRWKQARFRVSECLAREVVAVEPFTDGLCRIWFGPVVVGILDERDCHSRWATKAVSYWPPLRSPSRLPARRPPTQPAEK